MVDRFHDGQARAATPQVGRSAGIAVPDDFYGGQLRGVTRDLDYIARLGCTAIWLSPIFGTNKYYSYDINNYLEVDSRFGTVQDPIDLVDGAHNHMRNGAPWPMRVILRGQGLSTRRAGA